MKREDILKYLNELSEELKKTNSKGEILLFGGAVMCLVHNKRDQTKDVDALFEPKNEMYTAIKNVAKVNGLESDWVNDGVKGFIINKPEQVLFIEFENLSVFTVTPEYLLVMKLLSSRTGVEQRDIEDIESLIDILELKTVDEVYEIINDSLSSEMIMPRTQYLLEEIFEKKAIKEHTLEDFER